MKIDTIVYSHIESCLRELSDLDFQNRVWVRAEGPEVSSYVEAVCQLFDDTGVGDQLDINEGIVLSNDLDPILRDLRTIFHSIDYSIGDANIINHQKWPEVIKLSSLALELLEADKKHIIK